ncbi:MAG: phosphate signaling complex protein PhoU [Pseudomonadota bacterium]
MSIRHIVSSFTEELEHLAADILRMGGIAETMINDACRAVVTSDQALAEEAAARDDRLDALEVELERRIIRLLALRQPLAGDLRVVVAGLKVSSDLERIGDLSKNIAKRTSGLEAANIGSALRGVEAMGQSVAAQLHSVLNAYSEDDAGLALRVWTNDEEIDQHYNALFREVLLDMREHPDRITAGAHLMFIAKNLERIGDHCTNIAEVVHYQVTGDHLSSKARPRAPLLDS